MLCCAAAAQTPTPLPGALGEAMPQAKLAGQGRLTWWGFSGYDAKLWVAPGFTAAEFDRHAFVLELTYLRPFRAADIVRTSIEQMQRGTPPDPARADRWRAELAQVFPDVAVGDRIAGVYRPGRPSLIFVNGKQAGTLSDPQLARAFFGIWLAPTTSEPGLRAALLGETAR